MEYLERIVQFFKDLFNSLFSKEAGADRELHPQEILSRLLAELEKKKKVGIEDRAFAPNSFIIYLNPFDFEEISPLLSSLRDQLKARLTERISKKGYKLLSNSISLDLREDRTLQRCQMMVESSFVKEKSAPLISKPVSLDSTRVITTEVKGTDKTGAAPPETLAPPPLKEAPSAAREATLTRIVEEKKTRLIDNTRCQLDIVQGENAGESIQLKEGEYTFGRGREAAILLKDSEETVSRKHFSISVRNDKARIRDLHSTNGTRLNDLEVEEAELKKGDQIKAGNVVLKVA